MNSLDSWQLLPIFALVTYILYMAYYYALPTVHLRLLWFIAERKYHCNYIKITDGRITVKFTKNGEVKVIDRLLEIDVPPRFMVPALCKKFKGVLADIRNME